ncbi:hypothetical protein BGZ60DRAFT_561624 [Tricladium varicosporioides]|nr:hypothetical protein BGZ60DRAFT_561624 [Hymenoscyphus varicosporioides]
MAVFTYCYGLYKDCGGTPQEFSAAVFSTCGSSQTPTIKPSPSVTASPTTSSQTLKTPTPTSETSAKPITTTSTTTPTTTTTTTTPTQTTPVTVPISSKSTSSSITTVEPTTVTISNIPNSTTPRSTSSTTSETSTSTSQTPSASTPTYVTVPTKATSSPTTSSTTSQSTSTSISISYVTPSYTSVAPSTTFSSLASSTHTPLPQYTGSGGLLRGYCATPLFTVIPGPTADIYVGVVGCVNGKDDCCPFAVTSTHAPTDSSTTAISTTITLGGVSTATSTTLANIGQNQAFPTASSPQAATLDHCPDDYQTVINYCCPSNYQLFSTQLGGQTPCYSTVFPYLTPPPLPQPTGSGLFAPRPTSAVVNVVYAMAYPVKTTAPGLSTAAKAGVGAGASAVGLLIFVAIAAFFWHRKSKKQYSAPDFTMSNPPSPIQVQDTRRPTIPDMTYQHYNIEAGYNPALHRQPHTENQSFHRPIPQRVPLGPRPLPASQVSHSAAGSVDLGPDRNSMQRNYTAIPVEYGLPPEELAGVDVQERQELHHQSWEAPELYGSSSNTSRY